MKNFDITMVVSCRNDNMTLDLFTDLFIEFVESNNCFCSGGIAEVDDDGNIIR